MSFSGFAASISNTPWIQDMAGSWMFPALETVHVFSLVAVLGAIAVVDLRLLGLGGHGHSVTFLSRQALPFTWVGFALAVASGSLMFLGQVGEYATNPAFQLKLLLIVLAGLNMLAFHGLTWKSVAHWDQDSPPPLAAKVAGGLSLVFWIGVIACGRWIAFSHGSA